MKEIREIIKAYDNAVHAGRKAALAAVVHLEGSSYRRPGARMIVNDEGELTGAISGGCLEGDALRKALLVLSKQQSKLVTYDTSDEDDMTIGIQLGCAGVIQVLFEPIDPNQPDNPIQLLRKVVAVRQNAVLVTMFSLEKKHDAQAGTCLLMESNGNISGSIPYPGIEALVMQDVQEAMQNKKSSFKQYFDQDVTVTAFIEFLQPAVSMIVVGAGNDAIPMMQMADIIGWDVRVVDGRNTHAKPERFASACQVLVSKPEKVLEQIPMDERTVFVMMTHNYNYDMAMLKALLPKNIPYIGMLGPRKKLERMLDEIKEGGTVITKDMLEKLYGPTGLEIGAETAEEIALSIISEIQAVMNAKSGGLLREKTDVIHSREETRIEQKRLLK
ncbi:MAG TPA: XdhC family protein [Chitinophagaceae bacterium]|nr:XdhC family protein [Chitinophagaceae bacterium]